MKDILSPLIDACQWVLEFWHDLIGGSWGWSIILLTFPVRIAILPLTFRRVTLTCRLGVPAADLPGREVDAAPPGAPAGDQGDPGALQGRPPADEPGGHGLLPAREGQPARVLPAAAAADPLLHLALLPAALAGVQGGHRGQRRPPADRQPRPQS